MQETAIIVIRRLVTSSYQCSCCFFTMTAVEYSFVSFLQLNCCAIDDPPVDAFGSNSIFMLDGGPEAHVLAMTGFFVLFLLLLHLFLNPHLPSTPACCPSTLSLPALFPPCPLFIFCFRFSFFYFNLSSRLFLSIRSTLINDPSSSCHTSRLNRTPRV